MILRNCLSISALSPTALWTFHSPQAIGSSTYSLTLPDGVKIYLVCHVSHKKELLDYVDSTLTTKTLVTSKEFSF